MSCHDLYSSRILVSYFLYNFRWCFTACSSLTMALDVPNMRPFEYLRLTSLGVIGALVKVDDPEADCGSRYMGSGVSQEVPPSIFRKINNLTSLGFLGVDVIACKGRL